jgi:hypothetical protein
MYSQERLTPAVYLKIDNCTKKYRNCTKFSFIAPKSGRIAPKNE